MNQNDLKAVNELKLLAIDMINRAGSGNPGICMDMASVMYTLFTRVLHVYPQKPTFFNRDRVILSSAHITPLYYAMMHMAGFSLTKEDLMNYRRQSSNTPALPELNNPLGVDATTGVAGDGVGVSVGISLARRYIEALIKEEDHKLELLNFYTYCFISDADVMAGSALEAFSFAGTEHLNHLIFLYDANNMTSEGALDNVLEEDIIKKFQVLGFYVDSLKDASNIKEIERAMETAKKSSGPALIIFKNLIGKDSFNEGKNVLHSGPLSLDDTSTLRRKYGLFLPPFELSKDSILTVEAEITKRMERINKTFGESYARAQDINNGNLNNIINMLITGKTNILFDSANYKINTGYRESLMESNYKIMNLIAPKTNLFLGGSAGLSLTSLTLIGGENYHSSKNIEGRNIRFGPRERAMAYILNGMSLLGLKVYGSTKLCFANEMMSGLRSCALQNLPVTYIFTHDSLYFSEEGPLRIPVEQLTSLRSIPNLSNYRPADITELMGCWEIMLKENKPSTLIVSKNSIPKLPGTNAKEVEKGAYIIKKEQEHLDGIIIATGSEVVSALQIAFDLQKSGLDLRVVSMPCAESFNGMGTTYQEIILPPKIKTAVIEAGSSMFWYRFATNKDFILSIDDYVYGGIPIEVLQKMNFDYDSLKMKIETLMR